MADTRADVVVAQATWTNLYSASSIAPGTAVSVYNKGSRPCNLMIKATTPGTNLTGGVPLFDGPVGSYAYIAAGESGLWAYCAAAGGTTLLVQE